jgi:hypothetical protein
MSKASEIKVVTSMASQRGKMLTVELPDDVYAEFKASLDVFRQPNTTNYVLNWVLSQIERARDRVGPEEFDKFVKAQRKKIDERSAQKKRERVKGATVAPKTRHEIELPSVKEVPIKKRAK